MSSGAIDLSVGSVVAFTGSLLGVLIVQKSVNTWVAVLITLLAGLLIGVWQGFWIAYIQIPAFIVTLAGMLIFRGLTLYILQGMTLSPFPSDFLVISSGFLPSIEMGPFNLTALAIGAAAMILYAITEIVSRNNKKRKGYEIPGTGGFLAKLIVNLAVIALFSIWLALYQGIPVILIILTVLIMAYSFFTNKTISGRHLYAMGGNEKAAVLSGINTKKTLFSAFVNMGVLSAIGGIVFTSRLQAATPTAGEGFEMDAIAACYIGGAAVMGGSGTVAGTVVGALVMGVINNGLSIMGVGSDITQVVKGFVLLAAVVFDIVSKKHSEGV